MFLCKGVKETKKPKVKIPKVVFSIVWPILYLLIGYSWVKSDNSIFTNYLYVFSILLLNSWILFYSCWSNKNIAIIILILSIFAFIFLSIHTHSFYNIPLIIWLNFALYISL